MNHAYVIKRKDAKDTKDRKGKLKCILILCDTYQSLRLCGEDNTNASTLK